MKYGTEVNVNNPEMQKTLKDLLLEVNTGKYDAFKAYLAQQNSTRLNLDGKIPSHFDLSHLLRAIKGTPVTTLSLAFNNINDESVKKLTSEIKNSQIINLNLRFNEIGDLGVRELVFALNGSRIISLNLQGNRMSAPFIKELLGLNLKGRTLNVGFSGTASVDEDTIDEKAVDNELSASLNNLTLVNDNSQTIEDITITPPMSEVTITKSIEELLLEVNSGNYNDFRLYLIQKNSSKFNLPQGLFQTSNMFDFSHLLRAIKYTPVEHLSLVRNNLDATSAAQLASELKNPKLKTLSLGFNRLCDLSMKTLAPAFTGSQITYLDIRANEISVKGMEDLALGIKGSKIKYLNLMMNNIGNDSWKLVSILKGHSLSYLDLSHTGINPDGLKDLALQLRGTKITQLNISFNPIDNDEILSIINADGITTLCNAIPDTTLLRIEANKGGYQSVCGYLVYCLDVPISSKLIEAVNLNRRKIILTPYYATCLQYFSKQTKEKYFNLPKLTANPSEEEKIKYAGGIIMRLPEDLQGYVFSYFPLNNLKKNYRNQNCAKFYHEEKGLQENEEDQNKCSIM